MKANQRFVHEDDAVSPVIAVILMVAITVVLAATVYLWVSGFGNNTQNVTQATFAAKAVDLPAGLCSSSYCPATADSDSQDDAIQITYTAGQADLAGSEVYMTLDGVKVAPVADTSTVKNGFQDSTGTTICTNLPAGAAGSATGFTWARGASLYLWKSDGSACSVFQSGTSGLKGTHQFQVVAKNQVILDTNVEVHE